MIKMQSLTRAPRPLAAFFPLAFGALLACEAAPETASARGTTSTISSHDSLTNQNAPQPGAPAVNPSITTRAQTEPVQPAQAPAQTSPVNAPAHQETRETLAPAQKLAAEPNQPLTVHRLVVARDVKDREPVELESGTVGEPVLAFLDLANPNQVEIPVHITFEHESGLKVGFIELKIPAEKKRYRTWGRTQNIKKAGKWTVVIADGAGKELGRQDFTIESPTSASSRSPETGSSAPEV